MLKGKMHVEKFKNHFSEEGPIKKLTTKKGRGRDAGRRKKGFFEFSLHKGEKKKKKKKRKFGGLTSVKVRLPTKEGTTLERELAA